MDSNNNVSSNESECLHNAYNFYTYVLIVYVGTPMAILGIFTNILTAFLFSGRRNCGTSNVYFIILAFLDIFVCALYVILFSVDALALYNEIYPLWLLWMSYVLPLLNVSKIAQLLSSYMVVAATVERFCLIVNFRWITLALFSTARKRHVTVGAIGVTVVLFRLPAFFEYTTEDVDECYEIDKFSSITFRPLLIVNTFYKVVYNFYVVHVVQVFIPIISLIVLNVVIVYHLRRQLNLAKRFVCLFPEKCVSQRVIETGLSRDKIRKATYNLVAIVTSYLICNSVNLFLSITEHVAKVPFLEDDQQRPTEIYNYLTDAVSFLVMLNSSIRLFVHMASNESLRKRLTNLYNHSRTVTVHQVSSPIPITVRTPEVVTHLLSIDDHDDFKETFV